MGFKGGHAGRRLTAGRPGVFKGGQIPGRIISFTKCAISFNHRFDKLIGRRLKYRMSLLAIRIEQRLAPPPLELSCQLPAEIAGVLKAGVDPIAPIRRMTVAGVAGDKETAVTITIGLGKTQIPKADVVKFNRRIQPRRTR